MERYSVTDITRRLESLLRAEYPDLLVEGEITGFKAHPSGHWYFSVKDEGAVLACTMFRDKNQKVAAAPRDGDRVIMRGSIGVYVPRGTYQMNVRGLRVEGGGDLARRFEELRQKLTAEGLFSVERKRPIPEWPVAIGIATSPSGAVYQDLLKVINKRYPAVTIYFVGCRVQGEGAAAEIAAAIQLLNRHGRSSVLIVGRGGGSAEDLWAFNEEPVVRAIAGSRIPVISAVGHETDVTLADFAADLRAATPSAAAELATPSRAELLDRLEQDRQRLASATLWQLKHSRAEVQKLRGRLLHPRDRLALGQQRLDELQSRLQAAARRQVERGTARLLRVQPRPPTERIRAGRQRAETLQQRLQRAMVALLRARRDHLAAQAGRLGAMSPLQVLERGYALALREGRALRAASEVQVGERLELRLHRGRLGVRVEDRSEDLETT